MDETQSFNNKKSLAWFREYSTADEADTIGPEGIERFCEDIGVEPENILMLSKLTNVKTFQLLINRFLFQ